MHSSAKRIAQLTSLIALLVLALPFSSQWEALFAATVVAVVGFGVLYPLALSRNERNEQFQRGMQDVEVGPATIFILL
ncbi:hypothetical protein [Herbaspirillum sp. RV1423]|uniref:hypothetical protein n=1 Tax=Herbaspirillum sp. RV1423 TaxID=1443993 RepID=UPI0012DD4C63|nr:hypothetical protein [Herbaspirillum sp. RV1423]